MTRWIMALVVVVSLCLPRGLLAAPTDTDGDTISDVDEGATIVDTDRDGKPDYTDDDSDGDGIKDSIEAGDALLSTPPVDWPDKDGIPNFRDVDSDNDKLPDAVEDANGNGKVDPGETDAKNADSDGDGLLDGDEDKNLNGQVDPGEADPFKTDTDGDGIIDGKDKCPTKAEDKDGLQDEDGCPETDADDDGLLDTVELGHACLKPLVADTDGDSLKDGVEDRDHDGIVDAGETNPCKADTDGDGLDDARDRCPLQPEDFDGHLDRDGCPDKDPPPDASVGDTSVIVPQPDKDGDGLSDALEATMCTNPAVADTDLDGRSDGEEDKNRNGKVDVGETDPCRGDFRPRGGAGCDLAAGPSRDLQRTLFFAITLIGMALVLRATRRG